MRVGFFKVNLTHVGQFVLEKGYKYVLYKHAAEREGKKEKQRGH